MSDKLEEKLLEKIYKINKDFDSIAPKGSCTKVLLKHIFLAPPVFINIHHNLLLFDEMIDMLDSLVFIRV